MNAILAEVLKQIKPSPSEKVSERKFVKLLLKRISRVTQAKVVLTGSVAKDTYLRDSKDIDIFILFNRNIPKKKFENKIKNIMKKAFPSLGYRLSYAEHPYARFHFEGRRIDLVPAYKITVSSQRKSAVDRSVLHTRYILKKLTKKQKDQVLLLKKFLKSNELYGAEIKIEGFSGYLCELLILKYGSFQKLLRETAKWKVPVILDLEKFYKKKEHAELVDYFASKFIVIDPTDNKRNVASAVSEENLKKFVRVAKSFLKKPSTTHFFKKPRGIVQKMKRLSDNYPTYSITLPKPEVVDDVLWGQLKKLVKQLDSNLKKQDFIVKKILADDTQNKVVIMLVLTTSTLPKKATIQGPFLDMKEHVSAFKKHHKGARFMKKKKRIFAITSRKIRTVEQSIKLFFKNLREKGKSHFAYPLKMIRITKK